MNTEISVKGKLNFRETIKGFSLSLLGALVGLIWSGINPVILDWQNTGTFDITPFFTFVNWDTVIYTAATVGSLYFGYTIPSGKKKD